MVLSFVREKIWAPRVLVYYLRLLGLIMLVRALIHWAAVLGLDTVFYPPFETMSMPWRIMSVYFAALDAIAAVGLWFGAVWGVAAFLFAAVTEIVMYLIFYDMFGTNDVLMIANGLAILIYLALAWWAGTPENIGELLRLPPE